MSVQTLSLSPSAQIVVVKSDLNLSNFLLNPRNTQYLEHLWANVHRCCCCCSRGRRPSTSSASPPFARGRSSEARPKVNQHPGWRKQSWGAKKYGYRQVSWQQLERFSFPSWLAQIWLSDHQLCTLKVCWNML